MPPRNLLIEMTSSVSEAECAEMAIPSYLHRNPAMRWMAERRVQVLASWLDDYANPSAHVLDFGCGCGVLFRHASRRARVVYGADIVLSPAQMLVDYYGLQNVQLMTPDVADMLIPERSVDLVICGQVLEHVEDLGSVLMRFRRQMKPTGHLLVSIPTENAVYRIGRRLAGFKGEYHHHTAAAVHSQVLNSGFEPIRRKYIPFYGPLAVYWAIDYVHTP